MLGIAFILAIVGVSCGGSDPGSSYQPGSGSPAFVAGDPIAGESSYQAVCATCHGAELEGVSGLGGALVPSRGLVAMPVDELVALIVQGVPTDDPSNTTGVAMPPRGGNPSLTDRSIADIVAFITANR